MRIIARLDVKPPHVVKPIHFEGLRKMGDPVETATAWYNGGADEVVFIDIVASLYEREVQFDLVHDVARSVFTPLAVGGGIRTVEDAIRLIHTGADKVVLNTHAIARPELITEIAEVFGSQAVCIHIQAKEWSNWYECYTDCGRNRSDRDVLGWMEEAVDRGAGEFLISSVDRDGRRRGFDLELAESAISRVNVPVVIGSGAGTLEHVLEVARMSPSGIALSSLLHYDGLQIADVKSYLTDNGISLVV